MDPKLYKKSNLIFNIFYDFWVPQGAPPGPPGLGRRRRRQPLLKDIYDFMTVNPLYFRFRFFHDGPTCTLEGCAAGVKALREHRRTVVAKSFV